MSPTSPSFNERASAFDRGLVYTLVLAGGLATMASEMLAARLLAPYFGTSLVVWAILIGSLLLYMAVGYLLGGRFADRHPLLPALCCTTLVAGILIGIVPVVSRPVLVWSLTTTERFSGGGFVGSLAVVVLLFAAPLILLAFVSPFAVRLVLSEREHAGNIAGRIYALSTVGSIVGTILPPFVAIPTIGTRNSFVVLALALCAVSLLGLRRPLWFVPVAVALVVPSGLLGSVKPVAGADPNGMVLYEGESAYNYIQVVQSGRDRLLVLNEGLGISSAYNADGILTGGYWDSFLVAPFFARDMTTQQVGRVAVLGAGAGTIPRQYSTVYGPVGIDAVEIDPRVVDVGRRFFDMTQPSVRVATQDARSFLTTSDTRYDVVAVDTYQQPYIPFQFTTREFFELVDTHLADDGVVAVNCLRTPSDRRLVDVLASTMKAVFPSVYTVDTPERLNTMIVATRRPTHLTDFESNAAALADPVLHDVADLALPGAKEFDRPTVEPFSDDRAPIEHLVDEIVFAYLRGPR